jgi:hypothetical protein
MKEIFNYKQFLAENLSRDKQERIDYLLDKLNKEGKLNDKEKEELKNIQNNDYKPQDYFDKSYDYNKDELVNMINDIIENKYDGFTSVGELMADYSPVYKTVDQEQHLVEVFNVDYAEVTIYGGYKYETVLGEYSVEYKEMDIDTLQSIIDILNDGS